MGWGSGFLFKGIPSNGRPTQLSERQPLLSSTLAENHSHGKKRVVENTKREKLREKVSPEADSRILNKALRFERPPAPLVVRKARKTLG